MNFRPSWIFMRTWLRSRVRCVTGISLMVFLVNPGLCSEPVVNMEQVENVVAVIDGYEVTNTEYLTYLGQARRRTIYHGTLSADAMEAFKLKTMTELIDRHLLLAEAGQRGLEPDTKSVESQIQLLIKRYKHRPDWAQQKESFLAAQRQQLAADNVLGQLEDLARQVGEPSQSELSKFYENNLDKFTQPTQRKVSLILLGVEPAAATEDWEQARWQAESLIARLNDGEDFATLAREFSADETSSDGGNMGYLHQGTLNKQAESALTELGSGELSSPVRTLEGYAILRLDALREPMLKALADVTKQATALWQREQGEYAWDSLRENLRQKASIDILDPTLFKSLQLQDPGS